VFEEGYLRPDYITFERFGVNGYSQLPRNPAHFSQKLTPAPTTVSIGSTYWALVAYVMCYYLMATLGKAWFPHYRHHRPLTLLEAFPWVLSAWRKLWYGWAEKGLQDKLTTQWKSRYFLVPLQVFNDSQITDHARYSNVEEFIESTLYSFANHAANDASTLLVFKHHPMDRGYKDYSAFIKKAAFQAGMQSRVLYIHDQHLPSLLDHARGVVVINSTVGISALHHGTPTKVCGHALYDMEGLTYQGPLDAFWDDAPQAKPLADVYTNFRAHVVNLTQLNGSFYKALKMPGTFAGLMWSRRTPLETPDVVNPNLVTNLQSFAAYKQKLAAISLSAAMSNSVALTDEEIEQPPLVRRASAQQA